MQCSCLGLLRFGVSLGLDRQPDSDCRVACVVLGTIEVKKKAGCCVQGTAVTIELGAAAMLDIIGCASLLSGCAPVGANKTRTGTCSSYTKSPMPCTAGSEAQHAQYAFRHTLWQHGTYAPSIMHNSAPVKTHCCALACTHAYTAVYQRTSNAHFSFMQHSLCNTFLNPFGIKPPRA